MDQLLKDLIERLNDTVKNVNDEPTNNLYWTRLMIIAQYGVFATTALTESNDAGETIDNISSAIRAASKEISTSITNILGEDLEV